MVLKKKQMYKSPRETEAEASMKIVKFIAPKVMTVNGHPSPCECTDTITCAYCVQASLLFLEKKAKTDDRATDKIISFIKNNGIRKTARDLGIDHSTVKYWLKIGNIPQWVVKKYDRVGE